MYPFSFNISSCVLWAVYYVFCAYITVCNNFVIWTVVKAWNLLPLVRIGTKGTFSKGSPSCLFYHVTLCILTKFHAHITSCRLFSWTALTVDCLQINFSWSLWWYSLFIVWLCVRRKFIGWTKFVLFPSFYFSLLIIASLLFVLVFLECWPFLFHIKVKCCTAALVTFSSFGDSTVLRKKRKFFCSVSISWFPLLLLVTKVWNIWLDVTGEICLTLSLRMQESRSFSVIFRGIIRFWYSLILRCHKVCYDDQWHLAASVSKKFRRKKDDTMEWCNVARFRSGKWNPPQVHWNTLFHMRNDLTLQSDQFRQKRLDPTYKTWTVWIGLQTRVVYVVQKIAR